jgi:hypothetical protein
LARDEATRLHHEYVGTEHIMLALIREGEGVAVALLRGLSVDVEMIRQHIEETLKKGTAAASSPDLPYTSRAKEVLQVALSEAEELNDCYVGTEHLLLGLLRHGKGIAVQALTEAGVQFEQARAEIRPRLTTEMPVPPISARRRLGAPRDRILRGNCAVGLSPYPDASLVRGRIARPRQVPCSNPRAMYTRCIYCHASLGANTVIETFPVGRRLAFDAAKGRLWVVCRKCERWNLTPLEQRWEAVEDCERRFRAEGKRYSTEHIGLARLDEGLELVRIGRPLRPEFAAWRYGDRFGRRRRSAILLGATGAAVAGLAVAGGLTAGVIAGGTLPLVEGLWGLLACLRQFRVMARIPVKDGPPLIVRRANLQQVRLLIGDGTRDDDRGWQLELEHWCGVATLEGPIAERALGLIMPSINARSAAMRKVQGAMQLVEAHRSAEHLIQSMATRLSDLERFMRGHLKRTEDRRFFAPEGGLRWLSTEDSLAIEMAVHEENERAAMEGELELLEMAWQDAEEIAAIADNLLIPAEIEEHLKRLRERNNP